MQNTQNEVRSLSSNNSVFEREVSRLDGLKVMSKHIETRFSFENFISFDRFVTIYIVDVIIPDILAKTS